jgi:(p)ppGpp synthase/HD superfamily hydrolase
MATLERAIALAAAAHAGQRDKGGEPYILHPLRVMLRLRDDDARIVAVLHDVLEDTPLTRAALEAEGFSAPILDALDALTKRPGETRMQAAARGGGAARAAGEARRQRGEQRPEPHPRAHRARPRAARGVRGGAGAPPRARA